MSLLGFCENAGFLTAGFALKISDKIPDEFLDIVVILGLVFLALIVIMGIISIIRFCISLTGNMYRVNESKNQTAEMTAERQIGQGAENAINDPQLVAVITAAIMASMEDAPADGLVIRSIRKK